MTHLPAARKAFDQLALEAANCVRCERMCERRAVLSHLNGSIDARVMFIAEAPGRNGGDRTRIPFHGDASGRNFESLLASINLTRRDIFITNSVLCSPRKPGGANDRPKREEIRNCSDFLRRQIELVNPHVIATLGAVALEALRLIEPHKFTLRDHAARVGRWHGRLLVPLYHPSPQVIITARSLDEQKRDYQVLLQTIRQSRTGKTKGMK
ncbi:MAG TPA: uracil-DNA glycosylase [Blastocatellia bacterium]|nr:uracil-DNA glycosylase [Blastocatellia bacterium]